MTIRRLTGLHAADLPALTADLGPGLVALVGTPEDAGEVRRAIVWAAVVGDDAVALERSGASPGLEPLWGGTTGLDQALDAAVRWLAGPSLARVEAAAAAIAGHAPPTRVAAQEDRRPLLDAALVELRAREHELRELRAEWAEVTGDVEQATMEWLRERQDAETHLQAYRDRARELKARLADIMEGGADALCPTCGRPLADHLQDVRVQLREEFESVVQDGSWWKRRREQLDGKPEHLRAIEGKGVRMNAAVEGGAEAVERVRLRVRDLEAAAPSRARAGASPPEARALERLADELRSTALERVLREAGRVAERITAGRILWIRPTDGGPVAEGVFGGGVPAARDRAAVEVACRLAAVALVRAAGAPIDGIVVGESLEALDPEDRLRSVDALVELAATLGQVVVVTGTDVVDRRPEAFDQVLELRTRPLRSLPVGAATLRAS